MISTLLDWLADEPASPETPRLRIADRYADVTLKNQFARPVQFRRDLVDGRAVVINTMFTTCRGTCSTTTAKLRLLRKVLSPIFGKQLSFVSFTLEPDIDTSGALLEYAAAYGADKPAADLCDWNFLTGDAADIAKLRRSLGLYDLDPKVDADPSRHGAVLLFGNGKTDRWSVMPAGVRLPLLVEAVRRVAGFTFEQRYGIQG